MNGARIGNLQVCKIHVRSSILLQRDQSLMLCSSQKKLELARSCLEKTNVELLLNLELEFPKIASGFGRRQRGGVEVNSEPLTRRSAPEVIFHRLSRKVLKGQLCGLCPGQSMFSYMLWCPGRITSSRDAAYCRDGLPSVATWKYTGV